MALNKNGIRCAMFCALWVVSGMILAQDAPKWPHGFVKICAEDAGWPPFSFPPDSENERFRGFNADLLARIFKQHQIPYEVSIRPWKRCLLDGKDGDIDMVLDAAKNPERDRDYLLTEPIYELTPGIFFEIEYSRFYQEPVTTANLQGLSLCGQKGYIYTNFGLEEKRIQRVSKGLPKIIELLLLKRCDIGVARLEILLTELKDAPDAKRLGYQRLRDASAEQFYWMLNRHSEFSMQLKQLIDSEVKALAERGELERMLQVYFE